MLFCPLSPSYFTGIAPVRSIWRQVFRPLDFQIASRETFGIALSGIGEGF